MLPIPVSCLRLPLAALLVSVALVSVGARAGGMPPEQEIDANGVPIDAVPTPVNTASVVRATAIPRADFTAAEAPVAEAPVAEPSTEPHSAAHAPPDLASSAPGSSRDRR